MITDDALEDAIRALASQIDAPEWLLPTFGRTSDNARPHIEIMGDLMSYVVVERGEELHRSASSELDDLLFWVFRDVTFSMATRYEASNRIDEEDFRLGVYRCQAQLLQHLRPHWARRWASEEKYRLSKLRVTLEDLLDARSCDDG